MSDGKWGGPYLWPERESQMTRPDSGEREVCGSVVAKVNGDWFVCDMVRGHDGTHTAKLTGWLSAHGTVSIPLSLAQRILAALEWAGNQDRVTTEKLDALCRTLASELRARMPR